MDLERLIDFGVIAAIIGIVALLAVITAAIVILRIELSHPQLKHEVQPGLRGRLNLLRDYRFGGRGWDDFGRGE